MSGRARITKLAGEDMGLACGKLIHQDKGRDTYTRLHKRYCPICQEAGDNPVVLMNPTTVAQVLQGPVIRFRGSETGWAMQPNVVPPEVYEHGLWTPSGTLG